MSIISFTRFLFLSLILILPGILNAQTSIELDSIRVTASRISSTVSESGKNVSVLTQADIRQLPVTSVDELIRSLPGLNLNSRQGFGIQSDVGMRGSTFSQVLFLLDNVPLNDPLTAHFNTNIPVSLSEIGQIEVVRGPSSASYGADAVGGVIHIKTKTYMEREVQRNRKLLSYAVADISGGQNSLLAADGALELQGKKWRMSASVRSLESDGEKLSNPGFEAGSSDEEYYRNYFTLRNSSVSLSVRPSDHWSFYVRGGLDYRDFSARYFYTRSEFDESVEEITSRWVLSSITRDTGKNRSEINISYRSVDDIFDFNSRIGILPNEHTTNRFFGNISHQIQSNPDRTFWGQERLMAGAQLSNRSINSTDRGVHDELLAGFYLISQFRPLERLHVTASARLQLDSRGNRDLLPQLSTSYTINNQFTLRSSAGRAIRIGDFTERYISSLIPDLTPGRNIGNPDLLPEESITIDAGADWTPSEKTRFSITGFHRISDNLIDYVLTNSSDITNADNLLLNEEYFYTQNIASARTSGVEFLTSHRQQLVEQVTGSAEVSYTYLYTTAETGEVSKYIANHPSHQIALNLNLGTSKISVSSQSSFRVRSEESAALISANVPGETFVSNLNIEYRFRPEIALYSKILNLTDTRYQEILGPPMPGRWVIFGLRFSLP
jgi:iron complex outermembrane receptor protein